MCDLTGEGGVEFGGGDIAQLTVKERKKELGRLYVAPFNNLAAIQELASSGHGEGDNGFWLAASNAKLRLLHTTVLFVWLQTRNLA